MNYNCHGTAPKPSPILQTHLRRHCLGAVLLLGPHVVSPRETVPDHCGDEKLSAKIIHHLQVLGTPATFPGMCNGEGIYTCRMKTAQLTKANAVACLHLLTLTAEQVLVAATQAVYFLFSNQFTGCHRALSAGLAGER